MSEVPHRFEHDVETDLEGVTELVAGLEYVFDGETDETFPLDEGIEAISHVGEGHNQGTSIITM